MLNRLFLFSLFALFSLVILKSVKKNLNKNKLKDSNCMLVITDNTLFKNQIGIPCNFEEGKSIVYCPYDDFWGPDHRLRNNVSSIRVAGSCNHCYFDMATGSGSSYYMTNVFASQPLELQNHNIAGFRNLNCLK